MVTCVLVLEYVYVTPACVETIVSLALVAPIWSVHKSLQHLLVLLIRSTCWKKLDRIILYIFLVLTPIVMC
jgi:hypothetical protein